MYPLGKGEGGNGGAPEGSAGGGFMEKDNVLKSGERPPSSRRKAGCGAVHNGNNSAINKRGGREGKDCFEDIRAGKRRILRSDVARLRAEAEAARKRFGGEGGHGAEQDDDCFEISFQNGSDWIKVGEDVKAEKEEKLKLDVAKQTEESDTHMENDTEEALLSDDQLRNNPSISKRGGEETEAEKEWLVESCAIDHTEETHVVEQKTAEESDTSERKAIKVAEAEKKKITEDSDSDLKKVTEEAESAKRELTEVSDTSMKKVAGDIAYGAYQYESTSAIIERNGTEQIKVGDEEEVEMSRTMELDVAEADADGKEVMGYRTPEADHNANNSINKGNGIEWMKYEETSGDNKKVTCLDIAKGKEEDKPDRMEVGEETGTSLKKVTEENATDNNEATKGTTCGADQHEKSATITRSCTEQMKCGNGSDVNQRKAMKLDVANQSGEADTVQGKVLEEAASEAQHNRESSITGKNKDVNHRIKIEMRITRSAAAKQRKEAATDKRKVEEEVDADNNEAAEDCVTGADRNKNISTIRKRIGMDQIKCEEEINTDKQQIVGMDGSKHSEEARTGKKKVKKEAAEDMEQIEHMDAKVDNKRIRGLNVARQRNKTHIISENEKQKKGVDAIKKKVVKSGSDRKRCRETPDSETTRKKMKTELLKSGHDRTEGCSGKLFKFGPSNCRGSGPSSAVPATGRKVDVDEKTMRRGVRGQSRGTSNKKVDGRDEDNKKKRGFPMGSRHISKHHILPVKRKVLRKSCGAKMEPKSSNGKNKVMVKKESSSICLSKKNKATASEGRKEAKEKVREQIKNMLLNAGWRIDLRPRKGKNYEDSVYISPQGSGYWSITKAYEVFQKDFNHAHNEKGKDVARCSSKSSKRSSPNIEGAGFPSIPMEDLSILRKKIVKKSKEVLKKSKKKLADGRVNKKLKEAGNTKYLKHKDNERETKGKAKANGTAGSSLRGIVGHGLKKPHSGRHKKRHRGCALLVRGSNQEGETGADGYVPYVWKRTILSWMIDLGIVPSNGKVKYRKCTEAMLEGWIMRDGIKCCCCSKIFAVSKFEIHAGSKLSSPYQNIFVEETGASLCQCLLDAWKKQDDAERQGYYTVDIDGDDPNDDTCGICGDGGDLICCDGCPSTFHLNCLGFQILPPGDWHCMNCSCRFCGVSCGSDAHGNGGTIPPLLACSLCEEKYHQTCAVKLDDVSVSSALSNVTFCGHSCRELFEGLKGLLGVKHDLEAGLSWTVVQRFDEDSPEPACGLDQIAECNSKIAVALAVMNECFVPIIDKRSGIDLIHNVIYNCGSNFNRLNFRGFYTFILERGDEIICVATLRIHGTRLAEMPFVGTRNMYRRQGMCRRLLGGIESALCSFNVEKLIIPAISEMTETWINFFGFKPLDVSDEKEIKSLNMVVFPGAGLLQKPLVMGDPVQWSKTTEGVVPESMHHHAPEVTNESSFCSVVESEPQAAIMVTVQCEHEIKQRETRDGCTFSPCDMSVECSDASCGSKFEASDYKQLEASAGTKHDNSSAKIPEGGISRDLLAVNETSGEYTFDRVFVEDAAFSDSEMVAEPLNVINPLHTSVPEPNVHADGGVMLGISHKEDNDAGHAEQHPSAFSEGLVNHTLEKFKSLNAASKPDVISLGGLKSPKKVPSNLLDSSNVPTDLTSDVAHHNLQMVAKDSALIVPSMTGSCAFTKNIQPDSHSMIVDNTQVVPGQLSMTETSQEQSLCAASKLVSKPLDNCLQSTLQSPNMSNLQH